MSLGDIEKLKEIVKNSRYIVFFGGAGVSTESNIPDFRSETGLYSGTDGLGREPEYMLSHECFINEPEEFYSFYKDKMIYTDAKPNDAHLALAELEREGKLKAVVTQNIDALHQMAGSKNVYELHGSVLRNYCESCQTFHDLDYILKSKGVPHCKECGGIVKPDVVLYGESLDMDVLNEAVDHISKADTLIVGGTSLRVYPAASLIRYFKGKDLVLINKSDTPYTDQASLVFNDSIGKILSEIV